MKNMIRWGNDIQFEISDDEIVKIAQNLGVQKERANGYFLEINGEEYRLTRIVKELVKEKGFVNQKITKNAYDLADIFTGFGFRVWKKTWLMYEKNVLFAENIKNRKLKYVTKIKKFYQNRLIVARYYEFVSFMELPEYSDRAFRVTFEEPKNKEGFVMVSRGRAEQQRILFIDEVKDVNVFTKEVSSDLGRFLEFIEGAKEFSNDERYYVKREENLFKFFDKYILTSQSNPVSLTPVIGIAHDFYGSSVNFFSEVGKYNFYFMSTKGLSDKKIKDFKEMIEAVKLSWNLSFRNIFKKYTSEKKKAKTLQLKISVVGIRIWRRILINSNITLIDFHIVMQGLMNWSNYHLHEFSMYGNIIKPETLRISDVLTKQDDTLMYMYDFGDNWVVKIKLEKILDDEPKTHPVCLAGEKAGPLEDSGGVYGYKRFVKSYLDPKNGEHEDAIEWAGEEFDPNAFDVKEMNRQLRILSF